MTKSSIIRIDEQDSELLDELRDTYNAYVKVTDQGQLIREGHSVRIRCYPSKAWIFMLILRPLIKAEIERLKKLTALAKKGEL